MTFARTLRDARIARGLTQTALSKLTGIPRSHISDFEHSRRAPPKNHIALLCKVFGWDQKEVLIAQSARIKNTAPDIYHAFAEKPEQYRPTYTLAGLEAAWEAGKVPVGDFSVENPHGSPIKADILLCNSEIPAHGLQCLLRAKPGEWCVRVYDDLLMFKLTAYTITGASRKPMANLDKPARG